MDFPRRGPTLFDVLALLAVIGVFVVLVVPGIQKQREAARRAA